MSRLCVRVKSVFGRHPPDHTIDFVAPVDGRSYLSFLLVHEVHRPHVISSIASPYFDLSRGVITQDPCVSSFYEDYK